MSDLDQTDETVDAAVEAAADEIDVGREELLKRAIVALADAEGVDVPDPEKVAAIEARLDDLDAEVDEKVEDLRERFVELYRDLESKAPADHTHEETAEQLDALADELNAVDDRLDVIDDRLDAVDNRIASLESQTESIDDLRERTADLDDLRERTADLDDLRERAADLDDLDARVSDLEALGDRLDDLDEIEEKLSRVASAVVRVRRRVEAAERDRTDRERLDALTAAANREGVRKATCTNCGGAVDIGLLTAPECPHCGRGFEEVEPSRGFLGTSRLVVGDRPALDGEVDEREVDDGEADEAAGAAGRGGRERDAGPSSDVNARETDGGGEP